MSEEIFILGGARTPMAEYTGKLKDFSALELGAIDFVAKPDRQFAPDGPIRREILSKVLLVRHLRPLSSISSASALDSCFPKTRPSQTTSVSQPSTGSSSAIASTDSALPIACATGSPSASS